MSTLYVHILVCVRVVRDKHVEAHCACVASVSNACIPGEARERQTGIEERTVRVVLILAEEVPCRDDAPSHAIYARGRDCAVRDERGQVRAPPTGAQVEHDNARHRHLRVVPTSTMRP